MYTKVDLERVERAIADLQAGRRITSVQYGDTHVQYAGMTLEELTKMRSQILENLEGGRSSIRRAIFSTSKGVY